MFSEYDFSKSFHDSYRIYSENLNKKRQDFKRDKKKYSKGKQKTKFELNYDTGFQSPPEIELPSNPSAFAVYASIRLAVLDRWMRQANQEYLQSSCVPLTQDHNNELDSDSEDNSQTSSTFVPLKVSKIVGFGLRSVFELIKESRSIHPALCSKSLSALLDVLQGQSPEGLRSEPAEIIDPLFDLLLDLATLHGPESFVPNDGNHLTAIACSCLLSLVVVRGCTGKLLSATAALLMCPRGLAVQNIKMPAVLTCLQRSIQSVLLGKVTRPDWLTCGVPINSIIDRFNVVIPQEIQNLALKSLASDGQFLYLFTNKGLFKIGSGYGGTTKGHIYFYKPDFYPNDKGTLVFCGDNLYLKLIGRRGGEFLIVERQGLLICGSLPLHSKDSFSSVIFSDGEYLGTISPTKDEGFVVRILNPNSIPASLVTELPLKLAHRCVEILGTASFEEDGVSQIVNVESDDEITSICAGKEFGLIRTSTGKVLFCGKSAALGIKQTGIRNNKWSELVITKAPKVCQIAVGHEGLHAILLTEDGSAFFTGTARRGEDGDQNKIRRQPKPTKPKKMIKVDGHFMVSAACNSGSSALVTKDGELFIFGKDNTHADPITGFVNSLKGEFVVQVALGKAHGVILTSKGQIFTFGINNKYQCGRDFSQTVRDGNVSQMETGGISYDEHDAYDNLEEVLNQQEDVENRPSSSDSNNVECPNRDHLCPPGTHQWKHDMCMVCTVCRECTGYSISCLSSTRPDRKPGQECGCGEGDSGCAVCGCCRICAHENIDNSAADFSGMIRLDAMFQDRVKELLPSRQKIKIQDTNKSDDRKIRARKSLAGPSRQIIPKLKSVRSSPMSTPIPNTPVHRANPTIALARQNSLMKEQTGSDAERDGNRMVSLPPAKIQIPCNSPVIQIACGLHHSVLLLQNGQVYSFGSNQFGQLGCGDILTKSSIQLVKLPCSAIQIAAGSNHTVILTAKGEVYTFGNYQKGQLGRQMSPLTPPGSNQPGHSSRFRDLKCPWYAIPAPIPNIGVRFGRKATWVGASGDQTFLKIDESLINSVSLAKSTVTANKNCIVLLPNEVDSGTSFKCLVINKREGNCNCFKGPEQADFSNKAVYLDPIYNVIWSFSATNNEFVCYNIIASELSNKKIVETPQQKIILSVKTPSTSENTDYNIKSILSSDLALPSVSNYHVTRFQTALHLLCCLDTLCIAHDLHLSAVKEETDSKNLVTEKQYGRDDFQTVNRFESHGGGWGYSGHSIEAIRFMADTDILLGGFGLFGGRGEYTAKIKLLDIGLEGGEHEGDGEVLAETEEIPYECGPRQKYPIMFDEPLSLQAHRWYVAWCRISGPSSDCGSSGQTMITTDDQVLFYFKSSKKSNNGTDVNAGQIPQLLYKVITPETQSTNRQINLIEPAHVLSKEFSRSVSKECFQSLLSLLQWSWNTFKIGVLDGHNTQYIYSVLELEKLVYICRASLRLLKSYINEIYPSRITGKIISENINLAECIGDVRSFMKQILSDNLATLLQNRKSIKSKNVKHINTYVKMMESIFDEAHNTFTSCFHAFYPTPSLKWNCLCDLLVTINKEKDYYTSTKNQRLLSAVLCALCSPSVRLRTTFPLLPSTVFNKNQSSQSSSSSEYPHHYPILVEHMNYKSEIESGNLSSNWCWKEVLEQLLKLIGEPVTQSLMGHKVTSIPSLTKNCCLLLSKVVAELVYQTNSNEEHFLSSCGRVLHSTPSRFTRTNQSRTWNTGNGSPDAICFQVDRSGISIAGVAIYGGSGHYEYELELLEDQCSLNELEGQGHKQRWHSLEIVRGSFEPEDFVSEINEIKFDRSIPIKENVKYAIRLRNHGGRTNNGDGGLNSVKGSDNTTFTFSTCALSFNGTTVSRGQIPIILYYSYPMENSKLCNSSLGQQARGEALNIASTICKTACKLLILAREKADEVPSAEILSKSFVVVILLPLMFSHISPLVTSDPRSAVHILNLVHELLPHVSALNLISIPSIQASNEATSGNSGNQTDFSEASLNTTSQYYSWVQSDHPYKPATVSNYRVVFPKSVKWILLEFDPSCATAQPEDSLQLYIPSLESVGNKPSDSAEDSEQPLPFWPVLHKFTSCSQWPQSSVVLPGSEVIFSLETASDYLKDDRASFYGFKCLAVGYEWPFPGFNSSVFGLKQLEAELSFIGGMSTANLMKRELQLPNSDTNEEDEIDIEMAEMVAAHTLTVHSSLLSKGFSLNGVLSINQALDGVLPLSFHSNERLFLRDFVNCTAGTSGGRLAQWLQPGSRVDPSKCQVLYSRDDFKYGWPAIVTLYTRDQYSDLVHVTNMKVEVKAIPIDKKELGDSDFGRKIRRISQPDPLTFGGNPPPSLHHPYEPTIKDKMFFHSITVMKPYQNYSFEELRFSSPSVKRSSENMLVRSNNDGTYSATWTPASVGCYSIIVTVDGYEMEESFTVEVKEPPQGMTPPSQNLSKRPQQQPNKLRKFFAKNSAGLRIRAHPSLQGEQIGIVHVNETIAFIDEIHNDDGVWLRLSPETIKLYCNVTTIEAWCLQYNQHLGKTLLLPVEEPKTILDQVITDTILRKLPEVQDRRKTSSLFGGDYQVIKCGASGHNVRSRPSLKAAPVGMLVLGNRVGVKQCIVNGDGCWVQLDLATKEKYCFKTECEAWSLAMGHNNSVYIGLLSESERDLNPQICAEIETAKGYNFSQKSNPNIPDPHFTFGVKQNIPTSSSGNIECSNPFVFGENDLKSQNSFKKDECKLNGVPKLENTFSEINDKSFCQHKTNGNGSSSPEIFKSSSPPLFPSEGSGSTVNRYVEQEIENNSSSAGSPKSVLVAGKTSTVLGRKNSTQSDTSYLVSSLIKDLSQSPTQSTPSKDFSISDNSLHTRSEISPSQAPTKNDLEQSPKKLTQTGTQTSPENISGQLRGHFSIGAASKEERISPKNIRKERKIRPKRTISPTTVQIPSTSNTYPENEAVKEAISPSVAESLRAVFAAFLWHEGIVHDAMACASFLKFHPGLPKQGALVVTRQGQTDHAVDKRRQELSKEEKARQRHSVEVSAGTYLHIQPSTLETLTRSAANANANRSRNRKAPKGIIQEEIEGNYGQQTVAVLPPALKCLVYLWDELTTNCLTTMTKQMAAVSPTKPRIKKSENIILVKAEEKERNILMEKDQKKSRKKKILSGNLIGSEENRQDSENIQRDAFCELCGESFIHPVTFHMRQSHPGCGQPASGKGYNSSGSFCFGWAGNCGEGGIPGSSWYLLCEKCREKYLKNCRITKLTTSCSKNLRRKNTFTKPPLSPVGTGHLEPHMIMKNNAMFLLDLASSATSVISHQRRPSGTAMPSLSETSPPDISSPFGPLPPFQCLRGLGATTEPNNDLIIFDEQRNFQDGFLLSPNGKRPLSEVSTHENEGETSMGQRFHRSVSMGTNGAPWLKTGLEGRIIMMRKRNSANMESLNEGGSSLLCNPSPKLQKLSPAMDGSSIMSKNQSNDSLNSQDLYGKRLLERPVMAFILEQHDLESLQLAMKQALRKAMCRVYAMQALNWLLRSVTQPICIHDLLWWFVTSLTPIEVDSDCDNDNKHHKRIQDLDTNVCEHPLSDISIAGEAVHPLPSTFHGLLQTIADLMILLPMGSALQQMAVKCWGIRFSANDHTFLHRSQVFSNISKILSRSEELEDCTASMQDSHQNTWFYRNCYVENLKDFTQFVEIKASSRQAMVGSLTDGSTETFWESGDEDRNKTKYLLVACTQNYHPKLICVHVDNCRDLANKVSNLMFYSGINSSEFIKLRSVELENRLLGGWINCPILDNTHSVIRIEIKGPDNSVRIRQIKILGEISGESLVVGKQQTATMIQQKNCEAETLRVFRLITSQVFGKLITGDRKDEIKTNLDSGSASISDLIEPLEESHELREHMVGILFSRSKLTHLQKQVIVHIVQAIKKETIRVREEWESMLSTSGVASCSSGQSLDVAKNSDTYCFEMLSMVLALSGSSVGRAYLSHQSGLLGDVLSLLHTGSARVQRQVTALLRRMLPEITPESFAKIVGVHHLPAKNFGIITSSKNSNGDHFNVHRIGILDVFLSTIAKVLSVQVKMKGKTGDGTSLKEITTITLATSINSKDQVGPRWWLRGTASRKLAEVIVGLLREMSSGKLTEPWAQVTKAAIAENILSLTQLSEEQRIPTTCIHTPTLWIALASLCVLDKDHVERLSSGQWRTENGQPTPPRPTCVNHDDGETNAVVQCNSCGNLCADCDRFLHLHRKTRTHLRQVCKEEEEAIKVELHEGCGRTKLYWLLAVADASTLKALIEFREGGTKPRGAATSGICRFCGTTGNEGLLAIGNVCADHECQEYAKSACSKILTCGHLCGGVLGESSCLPCLHGCSADVTLKQDADDMCMICFTEALSCAPAIQLKCGHVFHLHCCRQTLSKRWPGPRITFSFSLCPICKENMDHPKLSDVLAPIQELYKDVKRKALMRLEYEGLHKVDVITTPGTTYYENPAAYAMEKYAYYVCYKCNKAYYGGEARCDAEVGENYNPAELVCGGCSDVARAQMCHKHGTDFLEYKCRYCCSVAVFFCFGTTHFCNPCHDDFQRVTNLPKQELPSCPAGPKAKQLEGDECPLHVNHPPTGEEFALGCGVCRNAHTF